MARILVIDDEANVRAMIERVLKSAGHKVVLAADGLEGVRRYQAVPADLVITDIFMPDQDGVETIMQFRKLFPEVPVIAMTGNREGDMLAVAKRLGEVAVLEKPFANQALLSAVEKAL